MTERADSLAGVTIERRVALRNRGLIDPRSLDQYLSAAGGGFALALSLELGPEGVIDRLLGTGLEASEHGRCTLGARWLCSREAEADEKYVVCNAVDADARAETARLLLGTDPYAVLEGLLIAALAVGASRAYVCVNAGYDAEIELVEEALRKLSAEALEGESILGSDFSCRVTIERIEPSLSAVQDTALVRALEGREPLPYVSDSDVLVLGLRGRPTVIESAETLAKVPVILQSGSTGAGEAPAEDRAVVAERPGVHTKIVTVSGDVPLPVVVEVPLGTTVRAVLEGTQGVSVAELGVRAVQFGGPAGAFLACEDLDMPIDPEGLAAAGAVMGSGSVHVYGRDRCAVETARDLTAFLHEQSCGQCVFCREGTRQLLDILDDLVEWGADEEQLELLVELGEAMRDGCICSLGREASTPVLSSLRRFAADYRSHRDEKRCPEATA